MFGFFSTAKEQERLEQLSAIRLAETSHSRALKSILKSKVINEIGIVPALAASASAGCVIGWLAGNKHLLEHVKELPVDELLQLASIYGESFITEDSGTAAHVDG